jgi:hypothetical protein
LGFGAARFGSRRFSFFADPKFCVGVEIEEGFIAQKPCDGEEVLASRTPLGNDGTVFSAEGK